MVWFCGIPCGLIKLLQGDEAGGVRMPTPNKTEESKEVTLQRHSLFDGVFCMADGLKLMFEQRAMQTWMNGACAVMAGHLAIVLPTCFVFLLMEGVILATVNAPGSIHDSTLAHWGGLHSTLEKICEQTLNKILFLQIKNRLSCNTIFSFRAGRFPFDSTLLFKSFLMVTAFVLFKVTVRINGCRAATCIVSICHECTGGNRDILFVSASGSKGIESHDAHLHPLFVLFATHPVIFGFLFLFI